MHIYSWDDVKVPDCQFHLAETKLLAQRSIGLHGHDFVEVMFVLNGKGTHQVNGVKSQLLRGHLCFIRPQDTHKISAHSEGLWWHNCAFETRHALALEERYFTSQGGFFLHTASQPRVVQIRGQHFNTVAGLFAGLYDKPRIDFILDYFLMNVYLQAGETFTGGIAGDASHWLHVACREIAKPENLRLGVQRFYHLACRSPEHCARELKKYSGKTPGEFVTDIRLDYAAKLLCSSEATIPDIAYDCGFENVSWFHRQFKKRYGITPLQFRKRNLYYTGSF